MRDSAPVDMGPPRGRKTAETLVRGSGGRRPGRPPAVGPPGSEDLVDEGELGVGGSGSVRQALDPKLRRRIAVKALSPRLALHPRAVERFVHEAQLTAQLEHPNIVPIHHLAINYSGQVYFTMRLVDGRTLAAWIDEPDSRAGTLERLHDLLQVFLKVCDAVAFAHSRGIIHCDIKPENIMVGAYGEVYLMDWGVAAATKDAPGDPRPPPASGMGRRRSGVRGTPEYMAPEQADGRAGTVDERTDVFALGTVLYRILTGKPPFEGRTQADALSRARRCAFVSPLDMPELTTPRGIVRIVLKAMSARPEDRYQSVRELRREVDAFVRGGWHLPSKTFAAGTAIVEEGAWGDAAYIIVKGTCEVSKMIAGRRTVVRVLGPGEVFGEMAILLGNVRTATVRALEEMTVKVVTREMLQEQLGADSWLGKFVLALADRFRELDQKVSASGGPPSPRRSQSGTR